MDISAFAAPKIEGTFEHPVTLPDGKTKTGLVLHLVSMGHERVKAVAHRHDGRVLRQSAARKDISVEDLDRLSGEGWHARAFDMTCAAVTGWEWGEDEQGEAFEIAGESWEFTEANVARLFQAFPWIAAQAREEAERVENFTVASPKP